MENNEDIEKMNNKLLRKKRVKNVINSVIVYILILVIYRLVSYNSSPEKLYKEEIIKYLQGEYDEEFDVKFEEKRNASTYDKAGSGEFSCTYLSGTDDNIKEYIYSFSPKNNKNIKNYVAYAYNIEEDSYEIYETSSTGRQCGEVNKEEKIYGKKLRYNEQKLEIKSFLESYLGEGYRIELYLDINREDIRVDTNKSFKEVILNDLNGFETMFKGISKLLENKDIYVQICYSDKNIFVRNNSTIKDYENEINQIIK